MKWTSLGVLQKDQIKNRKCHTIHRIVAVNVQINTFSPLADYMKSQGCATELSLAAKSVLVEDFGVGCVIHSYGGAHTLSPQISTSEGRRLLQNQEAVATETTLEPVRRRHIVQGLSEPWSEIERGHGLSGSFEFPHMFLICGTLTCLQKVPAPPHRALTQDGQAKVLTQQRLSWGKDKDLTRKLK